MARVKSVVGTMQDLAKFRAEVTKYAKWLKGGSRGGTVMKPTVERFEGYTRKLAQQVFDDEMAKHTKTQL